MAEGQWVVLETAEPPFRKGESIKTFRIRIREYLWQKKFIALT